MVQYYTLQEAAAKLHVTPDQLKEMAKKNEVRAFQDRGNLRFRAQEIDELARNRGLGSDPELQFNEPPRVSEPKSGPKSSRATKQVPAPTDQDFAIPSEEVPLGQDPASGGASKNTPRTTGTRSPHPKRSSPASPPPSPRPRPGSDSDVRLIGDTSALEFPVDSEVKIDKSPSPGPKTPGTGRKSKIEAAPDSGVRIVPLDDASDSDVKIVPDEPDSKVPLGQGKSKTPSDSDIRLEGLSDSGKGKREEKGHITEEIDLDAEELKAAQAEAKQKQKPKPRGSSAKLPTISPFELSEPEVNLENKTDPKSAKKRASRVEKEKEKKEKKEKKDDTDSSSDFELTPVKDLGSSPLELGSDENTPIKLDDDSDEVGLGELTGPGSRKSGINLQEPVDSGISLEQGGSDEMDIEERVPGGNTPRPSAQVDSSSEFELSLDDSDAEEEGDEGSSSSEFELTLDEPSSPTEEGTSSEFELSLDLEESSSEVEQTAAEQSDSEFELTIDEGGALEMDDSAALDEQDKDIFQETDLDVPSLDEESGSEAVALDEEGGDSSDFDLDVEDVDTESETGSEVVALDEDVDELAPAPGKKKKGGRTQVVEEEEAPGDFEDLEAETEPELEEELEPAEEEVEEEVATPARRSWGVFTPVCAAVGTLILFFVILMSYEMVGSMWGYHKSSKVSSLLVDPIARKLLDDGSFPKE